MVGKEAEKELEITKPLTIGEQYQLEKLKRFSEDPTEIHKVRRKLKDAGYGDEKNNLFDKQNNKKNHSENDQSSEAKDSNSQKRLKFNTQPWSNVSPKRRKEDKSVFPQFATGFIKSLIAMFTNYSSLLKKYGGQKFVKISFTNLFLRGCGFVLGSEVHIFINQTIIRWQETFRPLFSALYKAGWRDETGKLVLSPLEFNLLQVGERLATERGIHEIRLHLKDTKYILSRVNPFISCYYQLLITGPQKLLATFCKATKLLSGKGLFKAVHNTLDDYKVQLIELFDGRVEENFIIPLLEAIAGNILEPDAVRVEVFVDPISEEEYRADENLKIRMAVRARQYEKEFRKKMNILKKELTFLETVTKDLATLYPVKDKKYSAIELALTVSLKESTLKENSLKKDSSSKKDEKSKENTHSESRKHIIKDIYYSLLFFKEYYASLLIERVPIYREKGIEYVDLFHKNVFSDTYKELTLLHKNLIIFFNVDFANITQEYPEKDSKRIKCILLVSKICDYIFEIGNKLYKATNVTKQAKPSFKVLDILTLGKFKIPFDDQKVFFPVSKNQSILADVLNHKVVIEVLTDMRIFCFDFLRYFEPPMHYIKPESGKNVETKNQVKKINEKKIPASGSALQSDSSISENIFLDNLILPEENKSGELADFSADPSVKKTLLARLESYTKIQAAIDKLRTSEEID